jgi:hypothetical protein
VVVELAVLRQGVVLVVPRLVSVALGVVAAMQLMPAESEQAPVALVGLVHPVPVVPVGLRQAVREVLGRVIPVVVAAAAAPPIRLAPAAQVRIFVLLLYLVLAVAAVGPAAR